MNESRDMQRGSASSIEEKESVEAGMLTFLEKKYPETQFSANWVEGSWILDDGYRAEFSAVPREGNTTTCLVTANHSESTQGFIYLEDYFCTAKDADYKALMVPVVEQVASEAGIDPSNFAFVVRFAGTYGEGFDSQTDIVTCSTDLYGDVSLFISDRANLDEAMYRQFVDELAEKLSSQGFAGFYLVKYVTAFPENSAFTFDNARYYVSRGTTDDPTSDWAVSGVVGKPRE